MIMFDTKTFAPIKTIEVKGSPDGYLYDPFNDRVYILSHQKPHATIINAGGWLAPAQASTPSEPGKKGGRGGRGQMAPDSFSILEVGK